MGKYNRTLRPGINFIIPFLEYIKVPNITTYDKDPANPDKAVTRLRYVVPSSGNIPTVELIMDPPSIDAISKDNALVYPDAILYFRVVDPVKAAYEVENLGLAVYKLVETTLRQQIGILNADEIITGRERIGGSIKSALEEASAGWGTVITRVELEEIRFDEDVTKALSDQRAAELEGRALVAKNEREREAIIIAAEADKRKIVLEAEAKFEQERLEAEAEYLKASRVLEGQAKGTEALSAALAKNPEAIVALEALKAQIEVASAIGQSNNTLIIPEETAGLFGALKAVNKVLNLDLKGSKSEV
jgi:regulator of protease activity HflC (stomatin/prohibitin superfamily)